MRVELPWLESKPPPLVFKPGAPAVGSLQNILPPDAGVGEPLYITATCGGLESNSNPAILAPENEPGIYWGDPHVHTVLSNCHPDRCRSLNFCFTAARYCTGLDWVSAADHVSNGRCDFSKWKEQSTVSNLYNEDNVFATLPAYEASLKGGCGGDNNVYMSRFPDMFVDEYENGDTASLCKKLGEKLAAGEFFIVPHHTTRVGKHGEIPQAIYPGPELMPVVEIHSKWGTSEYRGNPNPLHNIHEGPSYASDLLAGGLRLGFIAGTDTHATMPSGRGNDASHIDRLPGLTAAICPAITRQNVFDSIRTRHCYAASLERILLRGTVAGLEFGRESRRDAIHGSLKTDMLAAARSDIKKIELVRNGAVIHSVAPNARSARLVHEDLDDLEKVKRSSLVSPDFVYYYVRVTCASGAQAWTSPVWIFP